MDQSNILIRSFGKVLDKVIKGESYEGLPPKYPDESLVSVPENALDTLDYDEYGQDETEPFIQNSLEKETQPVELFSRKEIRIPSGDDLNGVNVIGIYGDNKRILTPSFHLILARSSIVNFKYTKGVDKPYFYTKHREASAMMVLDDNIFNASYGLHTYNGLIESFQKDGVPMWDHIMYHNKDNKPYRFRYNHERSKKAPNSQSLGIAVKFQHILELASIHDIEFGDNSTTICIKEGSLFSNSTALSDIRNGLGELMKWKNKKRLFVAVSNKVSESRVLIKTLIEHFYLTEKWFPNSFLTENKLATFGTDFFLLKKLLIPGYRTPLIEFIEKTRAGAISSPHLQGLKPLTCYYHKRSRPYSFIRIEIPKFMWEINRELAEFAISVAIWQFELGVNRPLVLQTAAERCSLDHDRWIIEKQMHAVFKERNHNLIEYLSL
jgi:hypothetical protein